MSWPEIPDAESAKHAATFKLLNPVDGFVGGSMGGGTVCLCFVWLCFPLPNNTISGDQAKAMFLKSKLDQATLTHIW